jgi:hypothetical protein
LTVTRHGFVDVSTDEHGSPTMLNLSLSLLIRTDFADVLTVKVESGKMTSNAALQQVTMMLASAEVAFNLAGFFFAEVFLLVMRVS